MEIYNFVDNYVLFDLETTGLNCKENEIIEIGAIKVVDGVVVDTFNTLIKPSVIIDEVITNITGITNSMVESSPNIGDVLVKFKDFIGNNVLIAHNANFDIGFLRKNFLSLSIDFSNNYLDTLFLARKYVLNLKNYKLGTLAEYFNIDYSGAHRGLRDCMITKDVYDNLKSYVYNNV